MGAPAYLRYAAGLLLSIMISSQLRAQDVSQYFSTVHASELKLNFRHDLYEAGDRLTAKTRAELQNHLGLAYGSDPKQKLDLYMPTQSHDKAPVLIFLHGGGFIEGDRAHYGFIARPYANHGIITAVASYRLSGAGFKYPAPADDARAAFVWLHRHIAGYGGDPNSIFVVGHAAGALLAADLGVDRSWLTRAKISPHVLKGIVPVSGPYELGKGVFDVYAPTNELRHLASPILHLGDPAPRAIIAFGSGTDDDIEAPFRNSSQKLAAELRSHGATVQVIDLPHHNHIQTAMSLGDPLSPLAAAVVRLIEETRSR